MMGCGQANGYRIDSKVCLPVVREASAVHRASERINVATYEDDALLAEEGEED